MRSHIKYNYIKELASAASETIAEGLEGQAVCGALKYGRGTVLFRNTVWGADKRRWHLNFCHWALGLRIPGAADPVHVAGVGPGKDDSFESRTLHDAVKLKNGDSLSGNIENETFTIQTSYATLTFDREKIGQISLEGGQNNLDIVVLQVGDQLSGVLQDKSIRINLVSGGVAEIDKDKIKEITIRHIAPK